MQISTERIRKMAKAKVLVLVDDGGQMLGHSPVAFH